MQSDVVSTTKGVEFVRQHSKLKENDVHDLFVGPHGPILLSVRFVVREERGLLGVLFYCSPSPLNSKRAFDRILGTTAQGRLNMYGPLNKTFEKFTTTFYK